MKTRIFLLVYYWLILLLLLLLNVARLKKFTLGSLLAGDDLGALMIVFKPVPQAHLFQALLTCDTVNGCQLGIASGGHALFVGFVLCLFGYALSTVGMSIPYSVGVLFGLHFYSLFTNGTYDHVDAVIVTGKRALVVICSGVIRTENLFAAITFKGQEVLLLAHRERTVLTNVCEFH